MFFVRILVNKVSVEFVLKLIILFFFIDMIEYFKLVNYFVYNNLYVDFICILDSLFSINIILWY